MLVRDTGIARAYAGATCWSVAGGVMLTQRVTSAREGDYWLPVAVRASALDGGSVCAVRELIVSISSWRFVQQI
jgi:hypothetical protein